MVVRFTWFGTVDLYLFKFKINFRFVSQFHGNNVYFVYYVIWLLYQWWGSTTSCCPQLMECDARVLCKPFDRLATKLAANWLSVTALAILFIPIQLHSSAMWQPNHFAQTPLIPYSYLFMYLAKFNFWIVVLVLTLLYVTHNIDRQQKFINWLQICFERRIHTPINTPLKRYLQL